jgi:hypothetical protein
VNHRSDEQHRPVPSDCDARLADDAGPELAVEELDRQRFCKAEIDESSSGEDEAERYDEPKCDEPGEF